MARTSAPKDGDQYSEEDTQRRFLAAVKAGLNTKPKPRKSMSSRGVPAQSKKKRSPTESA